MDFTTKRRRNLNGRDEGPAPATGIDPQAGPQDETVVDGTAGEEQGYQPHGILRDPAAGPSSTEVLDAEPALDGPAGPDDPGYDPEPDADLLPAESNRLVNRWTIGLAAAVLMVASFGAGAFAQRHTGTGTAASGSGLPAGFNRQGAGSYAQQGQGYGNFGGGQGTGNFGALPGQGQGQAGQGGSAAAAAPVLVGQVVSVSGNTLTVKNFAGKIVKVTVPGGTAVSVSASTPLAGLKAGTAVSITGTRAADGSVAATGVTARAAAK